MATRSTPYGLFSACSIGDIDDKAYNSDIFVNNTVKGFTRLDTSVLCLLASKLMKIPTRNKKYSNILPQQYHLSGQQKIQICRI